MSEEYVVLVDDNDNEVGVMEKMKAHELGALHRAISVFIFNSKGELLLQKRAEGKYHSAGLWTNACCSHPRKGEDVGDAAKRRLYEEMGLVAPIKKVFSFVYKAELDNQLTEHEYDHVFVGVTDNAPAPDNSEVAEWRHVNEKELKAAIKINPEQYTEWFRICIDEYYGQIFGNN